MGGRRLGLGEVDGVGGERLELLEPRRDHVLQMSGQNLVDAGLDARKVEAGVGGLNVELIHAALDLSEVLRDLRGVAVAVLHRREGVLDLARDGADVVEQIAEIVKLGAQGLGILIGRAAPRVVDALQKSLVDCCKVLREELAEQAVLVLGALLIEGLEELREGDGGRDVAGVTFDKITDVVGVLIVRDDETVGGEVTIVKGPRGQLKGEVDDDGRAAHRENAAAEEARLAIAHHLRHGGADLLAPLLHLLGDGGGDGALKLAEIAGLIARGLLQRAGVLVDEERLGVFEGVGVARVEELAGAADAHAARPLGALLLVELLQVREGQGCTKDLRARRVEAGVGGHVGDVDSHEVGQLIVEDPLIIDRLKGDELLPAELGHGVELRELVRQRVVNRAVPENSGEGLGIALRDGDFHRAGADVSVEEAVLDRLDASVDEGRELAALVADDEADLLAANGAELLVDTEHIFGGRGRVELVADEAGDGVVDAGDLLCVGRHHIAEENLLGAGEGPVKIGGGGDYLLLREKRLGELLVIGDEDGAEGLEESKVAVDNVAEELNTAHDEGYGALLLRAEERVATAVALVVEGCVAVLSLIHDRGEALEHLHRLAAEQWSALLGEGEDALGDGLNHGVGDAHEAAVGELLKARERLEDSADDFGELSHVRCGDLLVRHAGQKAVEIVDGRALARKGLLDGGVGAAALHDALHQLPLAALQLVADVLRPCVQVPPVAHLVGDRRHLLCLDINVEYGDALGAAGDDGVDEAIVVGAGAEHLISELLGRRRGVLLAEGKELWVDISRDLKVHHQVGVGANRADELVDAAHDDVVVPRLAAEGLVDGDKGAVEVSQRALHGDRL